MLVDHFPSKKKGMGTFLREKSCLVPTRNGIPVRHRPALGHSKQIIFVHAKIHALDRFVVNEERRLLRSLGVP